MTGLRGVGLRGVGLHGVGLRVAGVHHAFGDLAVLDGLDFEIAAGEVTVIVGPSGCGKSTLLGILGGLVQPSRGEVVLQGAAAADCLNPQGSGRGWVRPLRRVVAS